MELGIAQSSCSSEFLSKNAFLPLVSLRERRTRKTTPSTSTAGKKQATSTIRAGPSGSNGEVNGQARSMYNLFTKDGSHSLEGAWQGSRSLRAYKKEDGGESSEPETDGYGRGQSGGGGGGGGVNGSSRRGGGGAGVAGGRARRKGLYASSSPAGFVGKEEESYFSTYGGELYGSDRSELNSRSNIALGRRLRAYSLVDMDGTTARRGEREGNLKKKGSRTRFGGEGLEGLGENKRQRRVTV